MDLRKSWIQNSKLLQDIDQSKSENQGVASKESKKYTSRIKYGIEKGLSLFEYEEDVLTKEMEFLLIGLRNHCPVKEEVLKIFNYLALRFKKWNEEQKHEVNLSDFEIMSKVLIRFLPGLTESYTEIDRILYKFVERYPSDDMHLIDPEELLADVDINDFSYAYNCMVNVYNNVNQCFDNAFLKLIEHKGNTWKWHYDWLIIKLLNSKIMYKICIGLKIFKTGLKVDEFKHYVTPDFCFVVFDLSQIPEMSNMEENEMARFVARYAKDCHDLIEKKGKLATYRIRDIFSEIIEGATITQCQIGALYELMKYSGNSSHLYLDLCENGLQYMILGVVHTLLRCLRTFDMKYHELDEEMRCLDENERQEFGGFSLEVVTDDDMKKKKKKKKKKKPCGSLNKYFFYDDAMKTLSMLSFLYNYVEKYGENRLQFFKVKSYVTHFVITLIHQRDLNKKIEKPIWIMEKILNTCHFIVFGTDEKKEKDIFLKLMIGEEIDEDELSCLKDFMVKNKLSYEDGKHD